MKKNKYVEKILFLLFCTLSSSADAVIGGEELRAGDPLILQVVAIKSANQICTGSFMSAQVILTAAHCVRDNLDEMAVVSGPSIFDAETRKAYRVVEARRRDPKWNRIDSIRAKENDLALLRIEAPVELAAGPLNLVDEMDVALGHRFAEDVQIIGYGRIDPLRWEGSGILRWVRSFLVSFRSTGLLMMDQRNGKGACVGDSGAPIMGTSLRSGQNKLIGIVNGGYFVDGQIPSENECRSFSLGVYLWPHLDWINNTLQEWN